MDPPLLTEAVPELAEALETLLHREGRDDLANSVGDLRIYRGGRTLFFVPPDSIKYPPPIPHGAENPDKWSYMYHPNRLRHSGGVPRRRWVLSVEEIDGKVAVLSVQHAGGLGPTLDALDV